MFATVEDVKVRHTGNATDAHIGAALADANAILLRRVPRLDTRITEDQGLRDTARAIVCKAVNRYLGNPTDVAQQQVGPFAVSYSANNSGVYFTQSEVDMLSDSSSASAYAQSVRVVSPFMR